MSTTQAAMTAAPARIRRCALACAVMLLAVAACSRYEPRSRGGPATTAWPTGAACSAALAERRIEVLPWSAPTSGACAVDRPVMPAGGLLLAPPPRTSCSMVFAWSTFEPVVKELARRHMGRELRSVQSYGSYACRPMTGNRSRVSLHASGRALDIAAFELADGRRISVQEDWHGRGAEARFLRAVARAACERFSVVLTPESDSFHHDHIHVDIGPWKVCDA